MSATEARETDPQGDAHPPAAAIGRVAGGDQQHPNPQDVPILSYYTPPKRRQFRVTVRHTRALVIAMAGLLLGTLFATGVWLLTVGPKLPTVVAHKPVGITDLKIAIQLTDRISGGEYSEKIYRRVLDYLRSYGMTVLDGEQPSGLSEQTILEQFRVDEVRKDAYNSVMWSKLPTGWLAVGPGSIQFWPDQGNWRTETWWKSSRGPQPYSGYIRTEGDTRIIYDLAGGMQGETGGGAMWATKDIGPTRGKQWQAAAPLRVGIWVMLVLGIVVALAALRTRTGGGPQWVQRWCLAWALAMAGLFAYAGWAIVPLSDAFQVWSMPTTSGVQVFGHLLAPAAAGLLLSAALWLHRWMGSDPR